MQCTFMHVKQKRLFYTISLRRGDSDYNHADRDSNHADSDSNTDEQQPEENASADYSDSH